MPRPYYSNMASNPIIEQPTSETGQSWRSFGPGNILDIWLEHVGSLLSTPGPNWANTGMVISPSAFFGLPYNSISVFKVQLILHFYMIAVGLLLQLVPSIDAFSTLQLKALFLTQSNVTWPCNGKQQSAAQYNLIIWQWLSLWHHTWPQEMQWGRGQLESQSCCFQKLTVVKPHFRSYCIMYDEADTKMKSLN